MLIGQVLGLPAMLGTKELWPWILLSVALPGLVQLLLLQPVLTTHLDEVRPGLGRLDYAAYLQCLDRLDADAPLMLEHLETPAEYAAAAASIREVARAEGLSFA